MTRFTHRRFGFIASLGAAVTALTLGVGTIVAGPTRGPIPSAAFPEDGGAIDRTMVPDFIPALGSDGSEVGWVSKELAVPVVDNGDRNLIPVYADDLRTIVGHMVARHGFAPLGTELSPLLEAVPTPPLPDLGSD